MVAVKAAPSPAAQVVPVVTQIVYVSLSKLGTGEHTVPFANEAQVAVAHELAALLVAAV